MFFLCHPLSFQLVTRLVVLPLSYLPFLVRITPPIKRVVPNPNYIHNLPHITSRDQVTAYDNHKTNPWALTFLHLNPLGLEEFTQLLDLLLELSDEFRVGVLVNNRLAHNLLGTVRISTKVSKLWVEEEKPQTNVH